MQDQATKLRRLVSRIASVEGTSRRARRIVLTGCKGGVGTTTMAISMAIALRKHASGILLVDANPMRGDIAAMCRLRGTRDIDDVLSGRQTIQQALVTGPAGIQVLPRFGLNTNAVGATTRQLVRQLDSWSHAHDYVVIDAGSCPLNAEALWPVAEHAVLVTTTDSVAVTDAYALLKSLVREHLLADMNCIVNKYESGSALSDIAARLVESCDRFLGLQILGLGGVPLDGKIPLAVASGRSVNCAFPSSPATLAIDEIANRIASANVDGNDLNSLATA